MVVSGTGVLTSSQANATFNGGLSNAATVFLPLTTTFNGPVTNTAAFSWQGTINNTYAQAARYQPVAWQRHDHRQRERQWRTDGSQRQHRVLWRTHRYRRNDSQQRCGERHADDRGEQRQRHLLGSLSNGIGTLSLIKTGTGTETLSGNNGYTGATVITGGTLKDGVANALPTATALTVSNATFDLNGNVQTVAGLSDANGTPLAPSPTAARPPRSPSITLRPTVSPAISLGHWR